MQTYPRQRVAKPGSLREALDNLTVSLSKLPRKKRLEVIQAEKAWVKERLAARQKIPRE